MLSVHVQKNLTSDILPKLSQSLKITKYIIRLLLLIKITEFSPRRKFYNFCIIKINLMLKKITLLLSASMFLNQHWPHNSKSTVGAWLEFQRWANNSTSPVETLVLVQCWANVSTPTMTLPNVDPTIACYLGRT